MMIETGINQIIFYVPLLPLGNLLLVERIDGRIYIIQNDELLTDRSWAKLEARQAIAAFQKMKGVARIKTFPD